MTLRITVEPLAAGKSKLRLEGRFSAVDLGVFEGCVDELRDHELALDLSGLSWIAPPAIERIAELIRLGAMVAASSPFLDRLLAECGADPRSRSASPTGSAESRSP